MQKKFFGFDPGVPPKEARQGKISEIFFKKISKNFENFSKNFDVQKGPEPHQVASKVKIFCLTRKIGPQNSGKQPKADPLSTGQHLAYSILRCVEGVFDVTICVLRGFGVSEG